MKIITNSSVNEFLNKTLTRDSLHDKFLPTLLSSLTNYALNPNEIVPPRTVQSTNNPKANISHIYMPCISPNEVGIKIISGGPSNNEKGLGFQGCVLILNELTGELQGILNATTLTAFRTALASCLGLVKIIESQSILPELCVFGVGLQAYWHVKLSLLLYPQVKQVNIINRTLKNAQSLSQKLASEFASINFNAFSYEDENIFINHVRNSSIIFGCTPSTTPIIKQNYINKDKKWPVFISLIGSYKPHMIELDLKVINELKSMHVSIIVDSKEHTLAESGELIQSNCTKEDLIEIHELYKSDNFKVRDVDTNLTVQKIVGLSVMDLSIGKLIYEEIGQDAVEMDNF
ncbi:unnamed protein product [Candida verbasci]|uniref:Uncharacterized protein n=1 Tax=Candida verbasci TaxID=1227364 RepID=A0A9W4TRJ1_9ASCO|nr:unnamed protein product [Candida verbasci]